MARRHNSVVEKEIGELLQARFITLASYAWSFDVVIATEKYLIPPFFRLPSAQQSHEVYSIFVAKDRGTL